MWMWSYGCRHSHEDTIFRFASRQGLGIGVEVQIMGWVVYVGSGGDPAPWWNPARPPIQPSPSPEILYKYYTHIIQISCKYCTNILQISYKYQTSTRQINSVYLGEATPGQRSSLAKPRHSRVSAPIVGSLHANLHSQNPTWRKQWSGDLISYPFMPCPL